LGKIFSNRFVDFWCKRVGIECEWELSVELGYIVFLLSIASDHLSGILFLWAIVKSCLRLCAVYFPSSRVL